LNLPKRSGHDVLQAVRASGKCDSVTVIILSSSDAPSDRADALRHGADDYFRKPLRLNFLALGLRFKQLLEEGDHRSQLPMIAVTLAFALSMSNRTRSSKHRWRKSVASRLS